MAKFLPGQSESPIGAQTLQVPVRYSPPSVESCYNTMIPSNSDSYSLPLVFGRKGTDHLHCHIQIGSRIMIASFARA